MARSRTVLISGAGIGGLTTALALAAKGFRVRIVEQAERLEESGAGIQLSPNATGILDRLGLTERIMPAAVAPDAVSVKSGRSGREIVRIPLGRIAQGRYHAPYLVIHRRHLQQALLEAVQATPDIALRLGSRADDFALHANGVTLQVRTAQGLDQEHGIALIGADGLWSPLRAALGDKRPPRFAHRTAWRSTLRAKVLQHEFREKVVSLWLGPDAHLVLYPVDGGSAVNLVAITAEHWEQPGWGVPGSVDQLLPHFPDWQPRVRNLLALPDRWLKWALCDRVPLRHWSRGPVTLLGDAAHPMLPFLAQGAAMAIEDAYVLAESLALTPDQPDQSFRLYEKRRRRRTARVQRAARQNDRIYHLGGLSAFIRNLGMRTMGGKSLLRRYDWVYGWRPPKP